MLSHQSQAANQTPAKLMGGNGPASEYERSVEAISFRGGHDHQVGRTVTKEDITLALVFVFGGAALILWLTWLWGFFLESVAMLLGD
jgi:hypothetical protein